jgi:hypothetical protein
VKDRYLEIIRADGRIERHPLEGERLTLGRSPEASIALDDAPELEPLHLLLSPREDGCWVSTARDARTVTRRGGQLFENGLVPWGAELDTGAFTFRIARAEVRGAERGKLLAPLRKIALLVACLWMASTVFGGAPSGPPRTSAEPPSLFADHVGVECPRTGAATERGGAALQMAQAKAERYPFSPHDGVEAVELYELARACLFATGAVEAADAVAREGHELRQRIEEDYRVHRLRLERALDQRRYRAALREARVVASLLGGQQGEYVDWLHRLDRALEVRIEKEDKKK